MQSGAFFGQQETLNSPVSSDRESRVALVGTSVESVEGEGQQLREDTQHQQCDQVDGHGAHNIAHKDGLSMILKVDKRKVETTLQ